MPRLDDLYLNAAIALGQEDKNGNAFWCATGFAVDTGVPVPVTPGLTVSVIITCKHVIADKPEILFRCKDCESGELHTLKTYMKPLAWPYIGATLSSDADDVGVFSLPDGGPDVVVQGLPTIRFTSTPSTRESDIAEGDDIYVVGFPLGITGKFTSSPVVRSGIIAQAREYMDGTATTFLVDAPVFPGNSGGFVLSSKPDQEQLMLIGMVKSYVPYTDVAYSRQTGQARVSFTENTGLTEVVPLECIWQPLSQHIDKLVDMAPPGSADGPQ